MERPKGYSVVVYGQPYVPLRFSEMASDLNGFVERYNGHEPIPYYTNIEKGIVFSVQDGHVFSVNYFPPANENGKRCEGFPSWDGVPPPRPYAVISNLNYVYAILDNFAIELSGNTQLRGYIITYAGRKSRRGEAKEMADGARKYLIDKRMISPDRFITIDGGFREDIRGMRLDVTRRLIAKRPTALTRLTATAKR